MTAASLPAPLRDALAGEQVLVVANTMREVGELVERVMRMDVVASGQAPHIKIVRAKGIECIEFTGGGVVRFTSLRAVEHYGAGRGRTFDAIYAPVPPRGEVGAMLLPCLATSKRGRYVYCMVAPW
ncbi:hypothetical protein [Microbacterium sp. SORGH_AS_0862]|uniref:hypothetical protein n=1 Tax=Microbacterium sp. SORGH_AS_0862 TaxID=3041789 RepID=UPI00278D6BE6|nr:hypothetical protein [Microbacterium sp. SORGH_AS_0862]MDQ1205047.1 hypothetical protein [Microbacterium sp. SORGH_AS_0862]